MCGSEAALPYLRTSKPHYLKTLQPQIMKIKLILASLMLSLNLMASNTKTICSTQITKAVDVAANTDYVLTLSSSLFKSGGTLNIPNSSMEHSVIIFQQIKPSAVIKDWLSYIRIGGAKAVDGSNCQVKMYNKGAIILPYGTGFHALTCYTGTNFSGTSYNGYTTGSAGGYMKTLSDAELNNQMKSFKLKRGYMVTFATGSSGWGYSRCFIADNEDLEMNLPTVLSGKVSSYRLFQWYNFGKSGIANNTEATVCDALNVQGCYTYNVGGKMTPDVEWLPHKIHRAWPGIAECGSTEYACTMKTDNEPANPNDDTPATVEEVLNYWEDAMRTGLRLCSPSTYDNSLSENWFKEFFAAIDARGWRCDLYDLHCYWSNFGSLQSRYQSYSRPLLISEWMWGSSWNSDGSFASGVSDATIVTNVKNILATLNSSAYVERYFYWNSETKAKIYDGKLTDLGTAYAATDVGLGYNKSYEYVPKVVVSVPHSIKCSFEDNQIHIEWKDKNGDIVDQILVQYKAPSSSTWTTLGTLDSKDKTGRGDLSYSFTGAVDNADNCSWRIVNMYDGKAYPSDEIVYYTSFADNIQVIPTNIDDFYFQFYSKEASTPLVWAVYDNSSTENRVYYKAANSNYASDLYQLWTLETNSNGGYSLRNVGEPNYLICSPNSWNFVTRNEDYTEEATKTAFGFEYHATGDYWVCKNLAHGTYVGLWDNDKNFSVGEVLAGNRTNATGTDSGDKIGIRIIPRAQVNDQLGIVTIPSDDYYLYNPQSGLFIANGNNWDTQAIAAESGIDFTLQAFKDGYRLDSRISNGGNNHYLGSNLYCDSSPFKWIFAEAGTIDGHQAYTISSGTQYVAAPATANTALTTTTNAQSAAARWVLLTRSEVIERMQNATQAKPMDVSFLLPCSKFGRNDTRIEEWSGNPTRGGYAQSDWGDHNGEKFNTVFDVYQQINDAPDGVYILNAQGFYRDGGYNAAASLRKAGNEALNASIYANDQSQTLPSIFSEAGNCGQRGVNQSIYGYIPDSQTDASYYIHNGLYAITPIRFTVENGSMRIGVKKTVAVENDWSLFDNFQLLYLGPASLRGDVNNDGTVDISDVLATVDFVLGRANGDFNLQAADVFTDGVIDISDVLGIVDIILGRGNF